MLDATWLPLAIDIADRVEALQQARPRLSPWLDTPAAASYLGLTVKTMQAHRLNGTGPRFVVRGNKIRRYKTEWLDSWLMSDAKA